MIENQKLDAWAEGTPEHVLFRYLELWKNRDWVEMHKICQLSWVFTMPDSMAMLNALHRYRPLEVRCLRMVYINEVTFEAVLNIKAMIARGVEKWYQCVARLICEKEPMLPDASGTWGVVPQSLFLP